MVISSSNPSSSFYPLRVKSKALFLAFQAGHDLAPFNSLPPSLNTIPTGVALCSEVSHLRVRAQVEAPEAHLPNKSADLRHHLQLRSPAIKLMFDLHPPHSHICLPFGPELGKGGRSHAITSRPQRRRATEPPLSPLYSDPGSFTGQR